MATSHTKTRISTLMNKPILFTPKRLRSIKLLTNGGVGVTFHFFLGRSLFFAPYLSTAKFKKSHYSRGGSFGLHFLSLPGSYFLKTSGQHGPRTASGVTTAVGQEPLATSPRGNFGRTGHSDNFPYPLKTSWGVRKSKKAQNICPILGLISKLKTHRLNPKGPWSGA